jgi:hypothetical protein
MKLAIQKVSQRGYQEKLGTSSVTIDQFGCALACLTALENYYNFEIDILALNNLLVEKGVYMERNLMNWWNIYKVNEFVKCTEWINCPTTPAPMDKVDGELNAGRPVIAHVDLNPNQAGADHFVVIFGKTEDNHYLAYDPWFKDEDAIFFDARYGEPSKGIFGLRLISGPVPQPPETPPDVEGLKQQVDTLKQNIDDVRTALKLPPQSDMSDLTKRVVELLGKESEYIDHLKEEATNLEKPDHEHPGYKFDGKWEVGSWLIEFWKKVVIKK